MGYRPPELDRRPHQRRLRPSCRSSAWAAAGAVATRSTRSARGAFDASWPAQRDAAAEPGASAGAAKDVVVKVPVWSGGGHNPSATVGSNGRVTGSRLRE